VKPKTKNKLQIIKKERGNSPNCDYETALLHKNWRKYDRRG